MEPIYVILCVLLLIGSNFFFLWTGFRIGRAVHEPLKTEPEPKRKVHKVKYQAGNLLDPITPEMQRLERSLEIREKEDRHNGE